MVWWLGRPSQHATKTDSDTAVGIGVVVKTVLTALKYVTETLLSVMVCWLGPYSPHYSN